MATFGEGVIPTLADLTYAEKNTPILRSTVLGDEGEPETDAE